MLTTDSSPCSSKGLELAGTVSVVPKPIDPQTGGVISPIVAAALYRKPRSPLTVNQIESSVLKRSSTDFERMRNYVVRFPSDHAGTSLDGLMNGLTRQGDAASTRCSNKRAR
jgi:hypothetical protein